MRNAQRRLGFVSAAAAPAVGVRLLVAPVALWTPPLSSEGLAARRSSTVKVGLRRNDVAA